MDLTEAGMIALSLRRWIFSILGLTATGLLVACGGSSGSGGPPAGVTAAVHPAGTSVVAGSQTQQFSVQVSGDPKNLGVTWEVDGISGGSAAAGIISATGLYTPPAAAGAHMVTATSVADTTKIATATIGVTDLSGITSYHYDLARDGVNSQEFALTTASVKATRFGKLFSCPVDGAVYTEPLWLPALNVNGGMHNVIFLATQHDSLYAFDADASPCQQLWHVNLLDTAHGGVAGETSVFWGDVGSGFQDITPEIGVTGTPVIDPSTGTLYVVSKSETSGPVFYQRLHAIDVATGNEKFSAPKNISASVTGNGDGSSGGTLTFNLQSEGQRPGLALVNGVVYVTWASHEDTFPYHGWILGYNAADVQQQVKVFNTSPNGGLGGIWMGGGAPAADSSGNLYVSTGNGTFDANMGSAPNNDYGDTLMKIGTSGPLSVLDYFTPDDQATLALFDTDLGSGGIMLLPDQTGPVANLLISGGKEGILYLVDRTNMGHFQAVSNGQIVQSFFADQGSFTTPAFWQNNLYIAGAVQGTGDNLRTYSFNPASGQFNTSTASASGHSFFFPGATPVISSSGTTNGVVWAVETSGYGFPSPKNTSPAILFAFDANNVSTELWDSSQALNQRDQAGNAVKFTVPTVANGKVYIGTRAEVDVYGLLP
jgi:hypothetical protein